LQHAKALGLRTSVTTNGYFLEPRRLEHLHGCLDILAVSLDGPPELHNRLRGSPKAFDRLCSGLPNLQQSGLTFGFIHTLTCDTWDNIEWIADFAVAQRAHLLQLHPLEMFGRADPNLSSLRSPDEALAKAYLLAFALAAKYHGSMQIQVDLLHLLHLLEAPSPGLRR
jgi:MoaA/NifB/PqqE/SkfB family radical SAM enzyme